jgi:hypothetical protein
MIGRSLPVSKDAYVAGRTPSIGLKRHPPTDLSFSSLPESVQLLMWSVPISAAPASPKPGVIGSRFTDDENSKNFYKKGIASSPPLVYYINTIF